MILLYLLCAIILLIAFGKIRSVHYYMAVLENKKVPFWITFSGKTVQFLESLISLQIFDRQNQFKNH
jgi:hypothetical protein